MNDVVNGLTMTYAAKLFTIFQQKTEPLLNFGAERDFTSGKETKVNLMVKES